MDLENPVIDGGSVVPLGGLRVLTSRLLFGSHSSRWLSEEGGVCKPFYLKKRPDRGNRWHVSYCLSSGKQTSWKCAGTTDTAEAERWAIEHNPAIATHTAYLATYQR